MLMNENDQYIHKYIHTHAFMYIYTYTYIYYVHGLVYTSPIYVKVNKNYLYEFLRFQDIGLNYSYLRLFICIYLDNIHICY